MTKDNPGVPPSNWHPPVGPHEGQWPMPPGDDRSGFTGRPGRPDREHPPIQMRVSGRRRVRSQHRRAFRRRLCWALVGSVAAGAALGGGLWPADGSGSTLAVSSRAEAGNALVSSSTSRRTLDATTIAATNDPAIVDVVSTLGYQGGEAAGTGVVLTRTGEILTNNHVIQGATSITVKISNGSQSFRATVVGTDTVDDLAVLHAQGASHLATVTLGNSAQPSVGQAVVAIGNAYNRQGSPTVTEGSITGLNRSITVTSDNGTPEQLSRLIETDASLAPGNSGGPLFDNQGRVIGINTAASTSTVAISTANSRNDGFAIPINDAVKIVNTINTGQSSGNIHLGPSAFLGVEVRATTGLPGSDQQSGTAAGGAQVVGVEPGTAAATAGITAGDTLTTLNGQAVSSSTDVSKIIGSRRPGDRISVSWTAQTGSQRHATVQLGTGPAV
jgi:S1-C subfamily serine protease